MATVIKCSDENILSVKELTLLIRQSIKNIIDKEGFTSYKVNVKDISTNGGNYLGKLQTVTVKGKLDNSDKELNLFLKNIVHMDEKKSVVNLPEIYLREGFFYKELLKLFVKIEDKFNIPQEERLNAVKGYDETNGAVIILEDISKLGYKTYKSSDVVTLKFAELAVEQLAKLHAMSFALKKEHPKYFDNKIKTLRTMYLFRTEFDTHIRRMFDKAIESLKGEAKTKLANFVPKVTEKFRKYLDVPEDEGVCLIHGDFRANNILVKEINGEASKVITIDYQIINYGYPVIDFIYFIFTATDQQFRKDHLENLKELYYNTFKTFLSKFGIEAKDVYSKKQFEESYREMLDYGLICFMMVMPFIFCKIDDIPDLENGLEDIKFNLLDCYKERMHGVVDDFIQWGYL